MRRALLVARAAVLAWGYAVTLGCLYGVRLFWEVQAPPSAVTRATRLQQAAEAALRTTPFIATAASLFAVLAIPLAAWAVGTASWGALSRYVYAFWSALAIFIVVSGNPHGLILVSGAGLLLLWLRNNRGCLNPAGFRRRHSWRTQETVRTADFRRSIIAFAIVASIVFAFLLLLFETGTKVYVSEILAIYAIASILQGYKVFAMIVHGQNARLEKNTVRQAGP